MIIIADSGSTKTTWCIIRTDRRKPEICRTSGINPFLQTSGEIYDTIKNEFSLIKGPFDKVYFYGAGCANPEKNQKVINPINEIFTVSKVFVDSDLMAAARSLCGDNPGIAAILGTGSNSCYYDGEKISRHISPLGYILGDEGSGAVLGRKLLSDVLKNQLPENIRQLFYKKYKLQPAEILDQVYRKPFPNRFMAQFTHFIAENIKHPSIYKLVKGSFLEFFNRNIKQFPEAARLPVNFTGSIGWYFRSILNDAAEDAGFKTGIITESPIHGLVEYHTKKMYKS